MVSGKHGGIQGFYDLYGNLWILNDLDGYLLMFMDISTDFLDLMGLFGLPPTQNACGNFK